MILRRREEPVPDTAFLNMDYLQRLSRHLGNDVTRELLADGMIDLSDRLNRVEGLVEAGDADGLARLAHEVAGAAGHLGLAALSVAAVGAQRELREDGAAGPEVLARIGATLVDLRAPSIEALAEYCGIGTDRFAPDAAGNVPE